MKVFICWSGDRGEKFAIECQKWIENVVGKALELTLSADIEKGGLWFDELTTSLIGSRAGIICLTPESVASPWIHFEAGILAKALEGNSNPADPQNSSSLHIFPFLFGVDGGALVGPLAAFQGTSATDRNDSWRLIKSLLTLIPEGNPPEGNRPDRKDVKKRFKDDWDRFETALKKINPAPLNHLLPDIESLFRRKTFDESVYDCLTQGWLERYDGARDVMISLKALAPTVRKACRRFVADVFDALIVELNAYGMCLSVLVGRPAFEIDTEGKVSFEHVGVAESCERRRKRIKTLVALLADERRAPVLDDAFRFEFAETFAERKRLVDRTTVDVRANLSTDQFRASDWDLERIIYNVLLGPQPIAVDDAVVTTQAEVERVGSMPGTPSLMALYYSLAPLLKAVIACPTGAARAGGLLAEIKGLIKAKDADARGPIGRLVAEIEAIPEVQAGAVR